MTTVLHHPTHPHRYWTTTNISEAAPGVLTPLGAAMWLPCAEMAMRRVFHRIGGLPRSVLTVPDDVRDRIIGIFHGRLAINVDTFVRLGNAMPGADGAEVGRQFLGFVPDDLPTESVWGRYPVVLAKFPPVFLRMPARAEELCTTTDRWYRAVIRTVDNLDLPAARTLFTEARVRFEDAVFVQTLTSVTGVQPIFQQLSGLAERAGVDPSALMAGHGSHVETALVQDLWDCSRGSVGLDEIVERWGYHGPGEGQVSGTVWRQDPGPLKRLVATYRELPDDRDPAREGVARAAARRDAEATLLAALPAPRRAGARLVLKLAERYLPLRGGCKVAFLQSLDVCRAATVRIGTLLAETGALGDPADVCYLTCDEMLGAPAPDAVIAQRRTERDRYLQVVLPAWWRGTPEPIVPTATSEPAVEFGGTGVSSGQATGRARIVRDPSDVDMEIGDVLVALTTDPSWASVMYPASALIVEVGGQLSHAAVVARELGIPCVMGIPGVLNDIPDGAQVRVDGTAGTVEVLL